MRWIAVVLGACLLTSIARAQGNERSYWLLAQGQTHEWCGYTDPGRFNADAARLKPSESAVVTYVLGRLAQVAHQVVAPGGDWTVLDKYTPSKGGVTLQRTVALARQDLEITQSAVIQDGRVGPLSVQAVTTLQGQKSSTPVPSQLPAVPVLTNLDAAPFMLVVTEMRHESSPSACRRVQ